jgi:DNA-binding NarL/FixJ family response regulator
MAKNKIRVFLVDDHQIVRDGIKALLTDTENVFVVGEALNGSELLANIDKAKPDIILMDISLPDISGLELTKQVLQSNDGINVIILSMHVHEDFITSAIAAGAKGYLPKNTSKSELLKAIEIVYAGREYFGEAISKIMLDNYVASVRKPKELPSDEDKSNLSGREIQILKMHVEGLSNKEISDQLFISIRTVESHKNHIMQKLGIKSNVELIKYALKNNIGQI